MLEIGTKAPAFTLPDQNGEMRSLADYKGKKVILYFYPKDMTAGWTKQACAFGELYPQFREKGAVVLGVSKDSVASHKKFEEKYGLPFTLLSDTEKEAIQAYDVWKEKKNYGKVSMGVVRTTYLIDEDGIIIKAFGKVKAADNPAQMLGEKEIPPERPGLCLVCAEPAADPDYPECGFFQTEQAGAFSGLSQCGPDDVYLYYRLCQRHAGFHCGKQPADA